MEIISVFLFIVFIGIYVSVRDTLNSVWSFILGSGMLIFFIYGLDGGSYETNHTQSFKEKTLVSVAPPQQELNGSISGNFLFFSGTVGQDTFYLLRERVSEDTYLDFKVVNGAYIVEDASLGDEGKFVQEFSCYETHGVYKVLGMVVINLTFDNCDFIKQSIVVPKGTVIKNMNGI